MATIWGMSVMATRTAAHQATAEPRRRARRMRAKFPIPGQKKVASTARTMPQPAQTMPLLAVVGWAMRFRPTMKRMATTK